MMFEQISATPSYFWLTLGGLLLAAEMLGAGGYLLWSGVSAVVVGTLVWLLPQLGWELQGAIFAVMTIIVAYLWWYWLHTRPKTTTSSPMLNQRNNALIGTRATLTEPIHNGFGRINIADSSWRAHASEDFPIGTTVEVVKVEGTTLIIRAVTH